MTLSNLASTFTLLTVSFLTLASAQPAIRDSFETGPTSWQLVDKDCDVVITRHTRSVQQSKTGQASEHFRLSNGQGTKVYLAHLIAPSRIHDELSPSVWIKSGQPDIQLLVRVVFPRAKDARGVRLTSLVAGNAYREVGDWQQLRVPQLRKNLFRQLQILRQKIGPEVDARGAYIDMLVLNAYSQAGEIDIWIDDLEVAGHVAANINPGSSLDPLAAPNFHNAQRIRLRGSVVEADGKPLFARVIQHNGEPFSWLRELGFNVIMLRKSPTPQQLTEARRLNVWIVAPPPNDDFATEEAGYNRVLAWHHPGRPVGDKTSVPCLIEATRYRQMPQASPSIVLMDRLPEMHTLSTARSGSRLQDAGPVPSKQSAARKFHAARLHVGLSTPIWATLGTVPVLEDPAQENPKQANPTQPHPTQAKVAAFRAEEDGLLTIDPQRIRMDAYQVIARGARGILFQSHSRLDGADTYTRLRAACLRRLNIDLALLQPWASAGRRNNNLESSDPATDICVLEASRARLLLLLRDPIRSSPAVAASTPWSSIRLIDSEAPRTASAYQYLPESGPVHLDRLPNRAGLEISVPALDPVSVVVVTENPHVIDHLALQSKQNAATAVRLDHEIASLWLTTLKRWMENGEQPWASTGSLLTRDEIPEETSHWASPYFRAATSRLRRSKDLLYFGHTRSAAKHSAGAMRTLATVQARIQQAHRSGSPGTNRERSFPFHDHGPVARP